MKSKKALSALKLSMVHDVFSYTVNISLHCSPFCERKRILPEHLCSKKIETCLTIVKLPCDAQIVNLYLTNGISHHYQLGESTFIFRGVRSGFYFFISFFDEISLCYAVCLCPTKRTPGLNELM